MPGTECARPRRCSVRRGAEPAAKRRRTRDATQRGAPGMWHWGMPPGAPWGGTCGSGGWTVARFLVCLRRSIIGVFFACCPARRIGIGARTAGGWGVGPPGRVPHCAAGSERKAAALPSRPCFRCWLRRGRGRVGVDRTRGAADGQHDDGCATVRVTPRYRRRVIGQRVRPGRAPAELIGAHPAIRPIPYADSVDSPTWSALDALYNDMAPLLAEMHDAASGGDWARIHTLALAMCRAIEERRGQVADPVQIEGAYRAVTELEELARGHAGQP